MDSESESGVESEAEVEVEAETEVRGEERSTSSGVSGSSGAARVLNPGNDRPNRRIVEKVQNSEIIHYLSVNYIKRFQQ